MADRIHATEVADAPNLELLAREIARLRYDRVDAFLLHFGKELKRQAEGDRGRGRPKLASLLDEAVTLTELLRVHFTKIFALCRPYMEEELRR